MVNGFQKEIRLKVLGFWSHIQIVPYSLTQSLQESGIYKYQDFYKDSTLIPEASHIQAVAFKGGLLKTENEFEGTVFKGVGEDFDWTSMKGYIVSGRVANTASGDDERDIVISKATASRLQVKVGDKLIAAFMDKSIRNRPFKVCGIFETGLEEFDKRYALCNISVIQQLNNWGTDTVGGFEVFLKEKNLFRSRWSSFLSSFTFSGNDDSPENDLLKDPIENITSDIYYRLANPKLDVKSIKELTPGIFDWLDLQTTNEQIITRLMMLVAGINMITMLLILIMERTNMIGIMKALGASNGSIRRIFIYYSILIISMGILIGNAVGIGLCFLQYKFHFIKLPQESYYLSYAPIDFNWGWILSLNIGTVVTCLLILLIPSMLIRKINPVEAIRFK
jgi:lipoprotein-releasing system permease protein